jgi:hypothetical protein
MFSQRVYVADAYHELLVAVAPLPKKKRLPLLSHPLRMLSLSCVCVLHFILYSVTPKASKRKAPVVVSDSEMFVVQQSACALLTFFCSEITESPAKKKKSGASPRNDQFKKLPPSIL